MKGNRSTITKSFLSETEGYLTALILPTHKVNQKLILEIQLPINIKLCKMSAEDHLVKYIKLLIIKRKST